MSAPTATSAHDLPASSQPPRISVVIPTYNSGDLIDRCLDALAAADAVDDVHVLDGGSSDGTEERAARRPGVRVERHEGTYLSHRFNLGFERAHHDLILMLNDDAFVDPETPARLAEVLADNPHAAVAGSRLRYGDGREQRSGAGARTLADSTLAVLSLGALARRVNRRAMAPVPGTPLHEVTWIPLCAALVSRAAWRDIGGFDERFAFYGEDQDFGRRLADAGWRLFVRDDAEAIHLGGGSSAAKSPGVWFSRYHQTQFLYLRKHYPRGWRIYALAWGTRATAHIAVWRARMLIARMRGDPGGERVAREWVSAFRKARRPA